MRQKSLDSRGHVVVFLKQSDREKVIGQMSNDDQQRQARIGGCEKLRRVLQGEQVVKYEK